MGASVPVSCPGLYPREQPTHGRFPMPRLGTLALLLALPALTLAGEFNKKLTIGDAAPAWQDFSP